MRRAGAGQVLVALVWRADTMLERTRGLLGRSGLGADEGMLIPRCGAIHTFFMRFAIDALFLDRQGTVRKISANLVPGRMSRSSRAWSVLDLAAGQADRLGIRVGDRLLWEETQ